MLKKRQLLTYEFGPGQWTAKLEGQSYIGVGDSLPDALADVLGHYKDVSALDLEVITVDEPLTNDKEECTGEEHTISLIPSRERFSAELSPSDDPGKTTVTRGTEDRAVCALMRKNRHLLRRGNHLHIIGVGDTHTKHRMLIAFVEGQYVATLEPEMGADTASDPIEAACGVITANPQALSEDNRLDIFFPEERIWMEGYHA